MFAKNLETTVRIGIIETEIKVELSPAGGSDLWGDENPPTAVGKRIFGVNPPGRWAQKFDQNSNGGILVVGF